MNKIIYFLVMVVAQNSWAGPMTEIEESEVFSEAREFVQVDDSSSNIPEADLSEVRLPSLESYEVQPEAGIQIVKIPEEGDSGYDTESTCASKSSLTGVTQDKIGDQASIAKAQIDAVKPALVEMNMDDFKYCDNLFYPEERPPGSGGLNVDPTFVKSVFNLKELVFPMSKRKAAVWCGYAAIVGGLAALEYYTGASQYLVEAMRYEATPLMAVIYGTEPLMTAINLLVAKYPDAAKPVDVESAMIPSLGAEDVAMVIPCHNSADEIGKTIKAALKHLKPEQIFILDNGRTKTPSDNTKEVVASINSKINYIWVPFGNKSIAQYAGAIAAKDFKYILTIDDDVTLPDNFDFGTHMINDQVKAVCYPVRAITGDDKQSLLVEWQDIEYQNSDLAKIAESYFGGVLYPHGAGSLWEKETLKEVLRLHDTVFYAEDVKMGLALQKVGKSMSVCATSFLNTEAPTTLFGSFPNYYQQRVRSWEMGRHVYFWKFVKNVVTVGPPRTVAGHVFIKGVQSMAVVSNLVDYLRLPLMVVMATDSAYWTKLAGFSALSVIPPLVWNYNKIAHRPDLQSKARAIVTVGAYKLLYSAVSVASIARAILIYIPNFKPNPTIIELEKAKDRRCVWLKWEKQGVPKAAK
ncbi:MAG: glycosyltransferase family 2 protein [Bdellovibrionia bacterium]